MGRAAMIRQHSRRQHQRMLAQDEDISRRRNRSRYGRSPKKSILLRRIKLLYIPTGVFLCMGIIMTLGSIIRGLGQGTIFWEQREQFNIIGPVVITVGVILLFITVGLMTHVGSKETNETIKCLTKHYNPITQNFLVYNPIPKVNTEYGCSIPDMCYEDEEYYVKNVKAKPMDYREEKRSNNMEFMLPKDPTVVCDNNSYPTNDYSWPEKISPKYKVQLFEEDSSHVSTPLLAGKDILLEKRVVLTDVSSDLKPLKVPYEDIWKLPESNI